MYTLYLVVNKEGKSRGVGGLPPTASEWPPTCCKTLKIKMRSQYRTRRRWKNDKEPENKLQKRERQEEFRNFRTYRRLKTRRSEQRSEQRSNKGEDNKNKNC